VRAFIPVCKGEENNAVLGNIVAVDYKDVESMVLGNIDVEGCRGAENTV
jgi:hypothetical protein